LNAITRMPPIATNDIIDHQAQPLRLVGVSKSFGEVMAVHGIDFEVGAGSMVSLIGPSGCGKTTTLRMIAGLEPLTGGRILAGSTTLSEPGRSVPPERRDMGMVFQTYALWPHMSVEANVGYGLKRQGLATADVSGRVGEVLAMVGMSGYGARYPGQLSGGQQQRVALARAVASRPRFLLFDEPLSNLDAVLREQMRFEIRSLQKRLGITSLYVTHSQEEALALSDRIVVMDRGKVVQEGTPTEIYERPRTSFVAGFIGLTNILVLRDPASEGGSVVGTVGSGDRVRAAAGRTTALEGRLPVSVRPSDIRILQPGAPVREGFNALSGTVRSTVFTGGIVDYFVSTDTDAELEIRVQSMPPSLAAAGESVILEFDPSRTVALEN
jgi:ABC-type Fe3+/spermidine/putrescine transport system ATPase subunit